MATFSKGTVNAFVRDGEERVAKADRNVKFFQNSLSNAETPQDKKYFREAVHHWKLMKQREEKDLAKWRYVQKRLGGQDSVTIPDSILKEKGD